jgi:hypothetical protein
VGIDYSTVTLAVRHADRDRTGAAEIDATAADERTAIGHPSPDRAAVGEVSDGGERTERPRAMRNCVGTAGVGVEDRAVGGALAVIAVADAVLQGDAGLDPRHRDLHRDRAGEWIAVLSRAEAADATQANASAASKMRFMISPVES